MPEVLTRYRLRFELDSNRRRLMFIFRLLPAERFDQPIEPGGPTPRQLMIELILLEARLTRQILATGITVPEGLLTKDPAEMEDVPKWEAATVRRLRVALTGNRKRLSRLLDIMSSEDLERQAEDPELGRMPVEAVILRLPEAERAVTDRISSALGLQIP